MRSRSCLRDGSRRNRDALPAVALLAAALIVLGASSSPGQTVDLSVTTRASFIVARVSFRWDRMPELASSLRAGMESRITFTVRLYAKRKRILPFTGDRLLVERSVSRSAFWDFLDGRYVVESENGARLSYAGTEELLQGFLTLADLVLSDVPPETHPPVYITARAQFEPVRLMPPLTLVSLMGRAATSTTPWVRRDAP
jgi:hypothetical protein